MEKASRVKGWSLIGISKILRKRAFFVDRAHLLFSFSFSLFACEKQLIGSFVKIACLSLLRECYTSFNLNERGVLWRRKKSE